MAGLKTSAEASGKPKKVAAKPKKDKSTRKPSTISAEYIVDSDSEGGVEDSNQSSKPIAGVKASSSTSSKAKNTATPPDTASKPNGSAKVKSVDQSAKKQPSGSGDTKVNGSIARSLNQPETKPSKVPETPSARVKGGFVAAAAKSTAKPISTSEANLPAASKPREVVENQDDSDEEDEETDEESSNSTGPERDLTRKPGSQPSSKAPPSSSKVTATRASAIPRTPATPKAPAPRQKLDSPESSESSTSDGSSSDEEDTRTTDSVKRAKQPQTPSKPTALAYKPPPGYSPATISYPGASHLLNVFSPTNLASKQIWHLTLPATIPISAIKGISMEKILKGGTALSHNGSDYGFVSDTKGQQNRTHVLLPNPEHNDFRAATKLISRSLHLQQLLKVPNLVKAAHDKAGSTEAQNRTRKVIHEQPSGLRMRYAPFGDETGTLGLGTSSDEDGELGPAKPAFRMPPSLGVRQQQGERRTDNNDEMEESEPKSPFKSPHKKRRMEVTDDHVPEIHPKKRRKKHRRDEGEDGDVVEETPAKGKANGMRDSLTEVNGHDVSAEEVTSSAGMTKKHEGETPEERAKRKAEKHQRKGEHKKRKEEKKRKKADLQNSAPSVAAEAP
ncbi:hypothetical protein MMC30_006680 [Trapelia coarctata]|nr:hypothetical protein [Trapelia coarctata]